MPRLTPPPGAPQTRSLRTLLTSTAASSQSSSRYFPMYARDGVFRICTARPEGSLESLPDPFRDPWQFSLGHDAGTRLRINGKCSEFNSQQSFSFGTRAAPLLRTDVLFFANTPHTRISSFSQHARRPWRLHGYVCSFPKLDVLKLSFLSLTVGQVAFQDAGTPRGVPAFAKFWCELLEEFAHFGRRTPRGVPAS